MPVLHHTTSPSLIFLTIRLRMGWEWKSCRWDALFSVCGSFDALIKGSLASFSIINLPFFSVMNKKFLKRDSEIIQAFLSKLGMIGYTCSVHYTTGRLKQENLKFLFCLGNLVRSCLKNSNKRLGMQLSAKVLSSIPSMVKMKI